ncbi:MAG: hypothetical protein DRI28_05580 [Caldiserica bacterium]|nr:MAG: hypothetical protein DRI28_05580 [Caldisericota bacterium]
MKNVGSIMFIAGLSIIVGWFIYNLLKINVPPILEIAIILIFGGVIVVIVGLVYERLKIKGKEEDINKY